MFVGAGRMRDTEQARKSTPRLVFIDEIDAVTPSRTRLRRRQREREQTLNALLAEMDGFDSQEGIIIIAATNCPDVSILLLRPAGSTGKSLYHCPMRAHSQGPRQEGEARQEVDLWLSPVRNLIFRRRISQSPQ